MISIFKIKKLLKILLLLFFVFYGQSILAEARDENLVNIYFFYSEDCSHCHSEMGFLDELEEKYDNLIIRRYEVHDDKNNELRTKVLEMYNLKTNGVPLTVIGDTAYVGYQSDKSNLTFIKTIAYYSKYGYQDKVGKFLEIENLPSYDIDEDVPTLDEFLKSYGNYKLMGSLYTDDFDLTSNALILGILSQFDLIKVVSVILVLLLLMKCVDRLERLKLLIVYLSSCILFNMLYIGNSSWYIVVVGLILSGLFLFGLINYIRYKKELYLFVDLLVGLALFCSWLENNFFVTYSRIFNKLLELNGLVGLEKISYYGNYLFIVIIINMLFVIIFWNVSSKRKQFN